MQFVLVYSVVLILIIDIEAVVLIVMIDVVGGCLRLYF